MTRFLTIAGLAALATVVTQQQTAAGLTTVVDSTRDTIVAKVSGVVPPAAVRHVISEMKVAPGIVDTTLFMNINEVEVDQRGFM